MKKKKQIQVFEYEGKRITFDFGDGEEMVNATEIVKAFKGKRLRNFTRLNQTKEFIKLLEKKIIAEGSDVSGREIIIKKVVGGDKKELQGTWYEKRLALKLAAWLSPEFELWIFSKIDELLRNNNTNLNLNSHINKQTLEFVFQKIKDNAMEIHHLSDILQDLENIKKGKE